MELERLETLKDSEKSKVYLVFDTENRRMLVEKHLRDNLPIYQRLMTMPHPYLPKLYNDDYLEWINFSENMEMDFPEMLFNFQRVTTQ